MLRQRKQQIAFLKGIHLVGERRELPTGENSISGKLQATCPSARRRLTNCSPAGEGRVTRILMQGFSVINVSQNLAGAVIQQLFRQRHAKLFGILRLPRRSPRTICEPSGRQPARAATVRHR
jgi:hypothetical protein